MQARFSMVVVVVVVVGVAALPGRAPATGKVPPACPPASAPVRYPTVQPVFARQCAGCHDARKAKNAAAQRVFEMSSYPFATERPATLLHDLRGMFVSRGGLTNAERCNGLQWVDDGGLDVDGNPPSWRR